MRTFGNKLMDILKKVLAVLGVAFGALAMYYRVKSKVKARQESLT